MALDNNPYYLKALEYIENTDLATLENGKHFIDGDNLFVNIVDSNMKTPEQARLEVHDKYIDIQIPLDKEESFGVKPRSECKEADGEFNTEKDILFFKDKDWTTVTVKVGEAITFEPHTAHAPLIGEGTIHKAIFKVKVA
ncbi:MAG: YhcH/YjgK/YiaL family protein [Bacteroidales bacterium]|nr:YhcH/YjgK/YiaL family protein [Bacteroidales bacterium]MDD6772369.1 YhcH/YjgK/YiaL family protein [Bacteroidales bacterium]MDO4213538.1 YhcH/YjgK/YiaL family protein [Bacteroidales bacterium]